MNVITYPLSTSTPSTSWSRGDNYHAAFLVRKVMTIRRSIHGSWAMFLIRLAAHVAATVVFHLLCPNCLKLCSKANQMCRDFMAICYKLQWLKLRKRAKYEFFSLSLYFSQNLMTRRAKVYNVGTKIKLSSDKNGWLLLYQLIYSTTIKENAMHLATKLVMDPVLQKNSSATRHKSSSEQRLANLFACSNVIASSNHTVDTADLLLFTACKYYHSALDILLVINSSYKKNNLRLCCFSYYPFKLHASRTLPDAWDENLDISQLPIIVSVCYRNEGKHTAGAFFPTR